MKYRMLKSVGVADGFAYNVNDVVLAGGAFGRGVAPGDTLAGWARAGLAEPIPEIRIEAAMQLEPETAEAATTRRRRTRGR